VFAQCVVKVSPIPPTKNDQLSNKLQQMATEIETKVLPVKKNKSSECLRKFQMFSVV
jgi:hypothetical protein